MSPRVSIKSSLLMVSYLVLFLDICFDVGSLKNQLFTNSAISCGFLLLTYSCSSQAVYQVPNHFIENMPQTNVANTVQWSDHETCTFGRGFDSNWGSERSAIGKMSFLCKHADGRNPKQPPGMYETSLNNGINYQLQLVIAGFLPSTVCNQCHL